MDITIGAPAQYLSYSNTLISQLTCCTSKGAGSRVHYPLYCRFQPHPLYSSPIDMDMNKSSEVPFPSGAGFPVYMIIIIDTIYLNTLHLY